MVLLRGPSGRLGRTMRPSEKREDFEKRMQALFDEAQAVCAHAHQTVAPDEHAPTQSRTHWFGPRDALHIELRVVSACCVSWARHDLVVFVMGFCTALKSAI